MPLNKQELFPCPFCGKDVIKDYIPAWNAVVIYCVICKSRWLPMELLGCEEFNTKWNARAKPINSGIVASMTYNVKTEKMSEINYSKVNCITVEQVKEIIYKHIKGFEYNSAAIGSSDFIYRYGAHALKTLLEEINEAENEIR